MVVLSSISGRARIVLLLQYLYPSIYTKCCVQLNFFRRYSGITSIRIWNNCSFIFIRCLYSIKGTVLDLIFTILALCLKWEVVNETPSDIVILRIYLSTRSGYILCCQESNVRFLIQKAILQFLLKLVQKKSLWKFNDQGWQMSFKRTISKPLFNLTDMFWFEKEQTR